jgi:peptide/nickel transport system permease protein
MPVVLWTDALIFLLLALVAGFAWYARRHAHLRAPWRAVVCSPQGAVSMVLLSVFIVIGLLDSLHYRPVLAANGISTETQYSADVLSLLDTLVTPLRVHDEKTYSAPFAVLLYAKETVVLPDGRQVREYPRLRYGGRKLAHPEDRGRDITRTVLRSLLQALLIWIVSVAALAWLLARRAATSIGAMLTALRRGQTAIPWRIVLLAAGAVLALIVLATNLAVDYHIFGTDKVGQDVFYQTLKSVRTGLVIGTLTTLIMLPFAILLGIMAGYFKGWVDDVIQYLYTTLNSIPGVLLIAAAVLMLQVYMANHAELFATTASRSDLRLLFLCIILGVTNWTGLCRLLRGETLKLRELDYIQAADAFGVGHFTIIARHILPNVMHIVLISVVLDFSGLVLAEAVLSYVGVGVDPSMNSWGNMINSARLEMAREPMVWWPLLAAFVFMFVLVLAANLFSDVVRDAFDPRLRKEN